MQSAAVPTPSGTPPPGGEAIIHALRLSGGSYSGLRWLEDGRLIGVTPFLFTYGLLVEINEKHYRDRYCFRTEQEALAAMRAWDGVGDPPGAWLVRKGLSGEKRAAGHFRGVAVVNH